MSARWDNVAADHGPVDDLDPDECLRLLARWRAKAVPMLDRAAVPDADQFEIRRAIREMEDQLIAARRGFRDTLGLFHEV